MPEEPKHPIQVVARRTGLTPEVLRIWEKRYGLVEPSRTPTGRRVYSDKDIERLRLVRRATLLGRRVGEVCGLSNESLEGLTREDESALLGASPPSSPGDGTGNVGLPVPDQPRTGVVAQIVSGFLEEAMQAVRDLDGPLLDAILNRALMTAGSTSFGEQMVMPLLRTIGEQWE